MKNKIQSSRVHCVMGFLHISSALERLRWGVTLSVLPTSSSSLCDFCGRGSLLEVPLRFFDLSLLSLDCRLRPRSILCCVSKASLLALVVSEFDTRPGAVITSFEVLVPCDESTLRIVRKSCNKIEVFMLWYCIGCEWSIFRIEGNQSVMFVRENSSRIIYFLRDLWASLCYPVSCRREIQAGVVRTQNRQIECLFNGAYRYLKNFSQQ